MQILKPGIGQKKEVLCDYPDAASIKDCVHLAIKDGVSLRQADLERADLTRAFLVNADLSFANLTGANLAGSNLTGANLNHTKLNGSNLVHAKLTNANLDDVSLIGANLQSADLTGANINHADFTMAHLANVQFGTSMVIQGGIRSDGYQGILICNNGVWKFQSGCFDDTVDNIIKWMDENIKGTPLYDETFEIAASMVKLAKIRGYTVDNATRVN